MDKLKMAHEYAIEMAKQGVPLRSCKELGWKYADAMQAEDEKRKNAEAEKADAEVEEILKVSDSTGLKPEVDWRIAPEDATHYVIFSNGFAYWYKAEKLECFDSAPSFGFTGSHVIERK